MLCPKCNIEMQKVQFTPIVEAKRTEEGGLNLYHAKEETAFFMIIQDEKGNRIYSFWECGQCGLTQMYRDREEELKRQPQSVSEASQGKTM